MARSNLSLDTEVDTDKYQHLEAHTVCDKVDIVTACGGTQALPETVGIS